MRHDPDARWPDLGYRFDRLSAHCGEATRFSCEASDLLCSRRVTLRVITEHAAAHERDLFEREADALARIGSHTAVVTLYERLTIGTTEVLVLQPARARRDAPRALATPEAVRTVVTLAGGVETAHRAGLLHGAIEPDAMLFDDSGEPLLCGFHRRVDDPHPPALHHASPHTAPEILLGDAVTEAVDVYGLGSTLHELITGHPAIRSYPGESPAALSLRVLTGGVTSLDSAGVPFELIDVLNWTLSMDPAQRPPSVAWLAEELGRIERGQGWRHTRLHVGATASQTVPTPRGGARHRAG